MVGEIIRIWLFKKKRYLKNEILLNNIFWGGLLICLLNGGLFYIIGSIFEALTLKSYFRLMITTQATFLSIIVAILMATVSSSPYTRTTKYILKKKWIVWKIMGLFIFSLLMNLVYFIGSGELQILVTLTPFQQNIITSYLSSRLELLPSIMASTGIALSLSLYYLITVRGILFSEERAIAESFESLIVDWFPREQIEGNVLRSDTPLGHFCRFVDKAVRDDDNYALDAAIENFEEITINFIDFHVELRKQKIGYSDELVAPTIEEICTGWKKIASVIVEHDHDYGLRVLMASQYKIIRALISNVDDTIGGKEIRSNLFECYFKILSYAFSNKMYHDELLHGMIGAPENRILYKWQLNILFDELIATNDHRLVSHWFLYINREFENVDLSADILVDFTSLVASWARNYIKDNSETLSKDFKNRTDQHWIYRYIDKCVMNLGKEIYRSDPLQITHWLVLMVSICDIASEDPKFTSNAIHQNQEEISWIIARASEAIGQLQHALNTGEKEFAELLALLMHLSDKESVEMGLTSVSQRPFHEHPYKISHHSNIVSFEDERLSATSRNFYDLFELSDEIYQDISIEDDEIEERIMEILIKDITVAIARSIDEDDLTESLSEDSYIWKLLEDS